jgi:RNA polymerase sigma-70 factor (ECF subfamily)
VRSADAGGVALAVLPGATPEPAGASDTALLAGVRGGDARALDALLERYWPAVFAYVLRRTGSRDAAADIAQDVFCRFWERRAGWRPGGSVRGLLFRIARNTAISQHRRGRARERATVGFAELYEDRAPAPLPAERAELRTALERAIAALPARRREVFQLRMVDDLSYDEVAEVMGISKQTVANQLSHALAALRLALAHLLD